MTILFLVLQYHVVNYTVYSTVKSLCTLTKSLVIHYVLFLKMYLNYLVACLQQNIVYDPGENIFLDTTLNLKDSTSLEQFKW